jgi:ribosomal protein L34E
MTDFRRSVVCDNMNHRRANAPVAHCPQCGGVVNGALPKAKCDDKEHALARRQGSMYCADCGLRLMVN